MQGFSILLELHLALLGGTISGPMMHSYDALEDRTDEESRAHAVGHRELLLHWSRAKGQLSSGVVEAFNTKAKLTTRKAVGIRI
jgi:hypothetical protein